MSGPKELLRNFLASSFPAPPAAAARSEEDAMLAAAPRKRRRGAACGGLAVAPGAPAIAAGPLAGPGGGEAVSVDVVRAAAGSTFEAAAVVLDGGDGVNATQSSDSDSGFSDPDGDAEGAGARGMSAPSPKKRERKGSGLRRDGHLTEAAYAEIQVRRPQRMLTRRRPGMECYHDTGSLLTARVVLHCSYEVGRARRCRRLRAPQAAQCGHTVRFLIAIPLLRA